MKTIFPLLLLATLVSCGNDLDKDGIYRVETVHINPFLGSIDAWAESIRSQYGYERIILAEETPNFWISFLQSGRDLVIARVERHPDDRLLKIDILHQGEFATDQTERERRRQVNYGLSLKHFQYRGGFQCYSETFPIREELLDLSIDVSITSHSQTPRRDGSSVVDFTNGTIELFKTVKLR